jgi:hypothetical protein
MAVNIQEIVDRFAALAAPRLANLLRLKSVRHVYESTPGELNSKVIENGHEVTLDRWKQAVQPYRNIERFISDERVMQYIIDPGLLPIVTAVSKDIIGRRLLVTRRIAAMKSDKGVAAHMNNFGIRVTMHFDETEGDTIVAWEGLYGVL